MKNEGSLLSIWAKVFSNKTYLLIGILVFLLFYVFNVAVSNLDVLSYIFMENGFLGFLQLLFNLSIGFYSAISKYCFFSMVIIGIMLGMFVSLISYKIRANTDVKIGKSTGAFAGVGAFIGAFVPGCAACGLGLLPLLGISTGFLTVLPFGGVEISFLSVVIMGFAIFKITKSMEKCDVCQVKLANEN